MADIETVAVAVRIRPLSKNEIDNGFKNIVCKLNGTILVKNLNSYKYNYVFDQYESQEHLYNVAVKNMIPQLMKGYNVSILAYGQTGSGKTHTMGIAFYGTQKYCEMGVLPRAIYDIFGKINEMSINRKFTTTCSFMELYKDKIYDLLSKHSREHSIVDIHEDCHKNIITPGLTEICVTTPAEAVECLIKGSSHRAVGATAMNAQSSRSHAIFTVNIKMMNETQTSTTSIFHLVDLAGSERPRKTKATGNRFKESVQNNQGLLALRNVITALATDQNYVGYRSSKLTRLLQNSLGGNSITLMIACVSPGDYNIDETLSTLRYADSVKKIKNNPIVNQNLKIPEITRLFGGIDNALSTEMFKQFDLVCEQNKNLHKQLHGTIQYNADLKRIVEVFEETQNKLNANIKQKFDAYGKQLTQLKESVRNLRPSLKSCKKRKKKPKKSTEQLDSYLKEILIKKKKNYYKMHENNADNMLLTKKLSTNVKRSSNYGTGPNPIRKIESNIPEQQRLNLCNNKTQTLPLKCPTNDRTEPEPIKTLESRIPEQQRLKLLKTSKSPTNDRTEPEPIKTIESNIPEQQRLKLLKTSKSPTNDRTEPEPIKTIESNLPEQQRLNLCNNKTQTLPLKCPTNDRTEPEPIKTLESRIPEQQRLKLLKTSKSLTNDRTEPEPIRTIEFNIPEQQRLKLCNNKTRTLPLKCPTNDRTEPEPIKTLESRIPDQQRLKLLKTSKSPTNDRTEPEPIKTIESNIPEQQQLNLCNNKTQTLPLKCPTNDRTEQEPIKILESRIPEQQRLKLLKTSQSPTNNRTEPEPIRTIESKIPE